jgi:hypothetical protein
MKLIRWLALPVLVFGLAGCPAPGGPAADPPMEWDRVPVSIQGRLAEEVPAEGLAEAPVVGEDEVVHLYPEVRFSRDDVRYAEAVPDSDPLALRIWFTEEGAERVADVTAEHPGRRFALLVNGHVVSAPQIVQPLRPSPDIPVTVEVRLPQPEAERLAQAIAQTWPPEEAPQPQDTLPAAEEEPVTDEPAEDAAPADAETVPGEG